MKAQGNLHEEGGKPRSSPHPVVTAWPVLSVLSPGRHGGAPSHPGTGIEHKPPRVMRGPLEGARLGVTMYVARWFHRPTAASFSFWYPAKGDMGRSTPTEGRQQVARGARSQHRFHLQSHVFFHSSASRKPSLRTNGLTIPRSTRAYNAASRYHAADAGSHSNHQLAPPPPLNGDSALPRS